MVTENKAHVASLFSFCHLISRSVMETSVLNAAHEKQRRAEALLREGRFEEAAKCHEAVADLLEEAHTKLESNLKHLHTNSISNQESPRIVTSIHSLITLESLALQHDYHKRQAAVVRMKQARYEEYKATLENQQRELLSKQAPKQLEKESSTKLLWDESEGPLDKAIYKTLDKQEKLLDQICLSDNTNKDLKRRKDILTVADDLRSVNARMRFLAVALISQLKSKEEEVQQLTEQLKSTTMNPNDDIKHDEVHSLHLAPLPPLTPLEMPSFDFTSA